MRSRLTILAVALTFMVGCFGVNEKNWNKKVSKKFCKMHKKCNATEFYANFDSLGTCVEAEQSMLTTLDGYYSNCDFNKPNAKLCLDGLGSSCQALGAEYDLRVAACFQVYDCANDYSLSDTGDSTVTTGS